MTFRNNYERMECSITVLLIKKFLVTKEGNFIMVSSSDMIELYST